jgi:hypothetical protein
MTLLSKRLVEDPFPYDLRQWGIEGNNIAVKPRCPGEV